MKSELSKEKKMKMEDSVSWFVSSYDIQNEKILV